MKCVYLIIFLMLVGCAQGPSGITWGSSDSGGSNTINLQVAALNNANQTQALAIIQQNCTICHGTASGPYNIYDVTDVYHLVSTGLVTAGSLAQSTLYQQVVSDSMPPGNPLSSSDKATLSGWITGD